MRIALVADWLTTFGGAEHVLAELCDLFPGAPLFTTVARRGKLGSLDRADIRTSRLQRLYQLIGNHQILLPLMPRMIEDIDLRGFDVILSSSHAVAKGVVPPSDAVHVCYCHTPVRYAWEMEEEYLRDFRVPNWARKRVKRELSKLRRWDMTTTKRVDVFLANSTTTQERIKRIYGRESRVVAPPVDDRFFEERVAGSDERLAPKEDSFATRYPLPATRYFLAIGRLVPYKRFDLLIETANALRLPLKIAGRGQDEARLRAMAGPTVEFLGFVPEDALAALYAGAKGLLFPQHEDAGVVLLEAQACGTPAVAFKAGGALDVVADGENGVLFETQTADSLRAAVERFETISFDRASIRAKAERFRRGRFRDDVRAAVEQAYTLRHAPSRHSLA
jgi:glycosyltransferase involved in cell wall biosynthesis